MGMGNCDVWYLVCIKLSSNSYPPLSLLWCCFLIRLLELLMLVVRALFCFISPYIYILLLLLCGLCWHSIIALAWLRKGFCQIIKKVLKIAPCGLLFGGPPCGSWVYINRATSKRSARRIFGDCSRLYVRHANTSLSSIYNICNIVQLSYMY